MSGPVRPPLTVEESDGSVVVRPANTIKFNAADFTVAKSGSEATISIDSTGTGAALTDTQVGFGNSSNLLTGSSLFTYDDTAGSELLTISGSGTSDLVKLVSTDAAASAAPRFTMYRNSASPANNDFTGRFNFRGEKADGSELDYGVIINRITDATNGNGRLQFLAANGTATNVDNSQLIINGGSVVINEAGNDVDFRVESDTRSNAFKVAGDTGFVGINEGSPEVALEITDDGSGSTLLQLQGTDPDANVGPSMNFWRNSASPADGDNLGQIQFLGEDSGGSRQQFGNFYMDADVVTAGAESGSFRFNVFLAGSSREAFRIRGSEVVVNESQLDIDFRVESDTQQYAFQVDGARSAIGIGAIATDSDKVNVVADAAFDPTTSTDADMYNTINIDSSAASSGQGNYGGALTFTGLGSTRRRAGIANVQTTSDQDEVGIAFFTHDPASPSSDETLNEHMRLDDNGRLFISDTDIGTETAAGRLAVREVNAGNATALLESTESSNADYGPVLELYRNSSSPANNDTIGQIIFTANDNTPNKIEYFRINVIQKDVTSAGEDSTVDFQIYEGGSPRTHLRLDKNEVVINDSQRNVDFRVESDTNSNFFEIVANTTTGGNAGFGATPTSGEAQLQVDDDLSFYRYVLAERTSNHDVTVIEAHGGVLHMKTSSGTGNFNLPAAVAGMHLRLINTGAGMNVVTNAGDSLNGVTNSGTTATLAAAITGFGSALELTCIASGAWIANNMAAPTAT